MYPITFCGESAGGVAYKQLSASRRETSGGVAEKEGDDSIGIETPDNAKDYVSFSGRGSYEDKKNGSALGTLALIGFSAAALVAGLGFAKKYNWFDSIKNPKVKDYVSKYGTDPSYKCCQYLKKQANKCYEGICSFFKSEK